MELELRALMPEDAGAARAFVAEQFSSTRYAPRILEQLDAALQFDDPEYMALLACAEPDARPVGLVLFGTVAGARAVVKVHAIVSGDPRAADALLDAVYQASAESGERMIVCELPDDTPFASTARALAANGYAEEGRVADFVCDGVALRLLVRRLIST